MKTRKIISLTIAIFSYLSFYQFCFAQGVHHWETVVYAQDNWRYLLGNSEPDTDWNILGFIDTSWAIGPGGIGYGDGDDGTEVEPVISLYMRTTFTIQDTDQISRALFNIDYDDAFVAYLNGVEIARANIGEPGNFEPFNQTSTGFHEAQMYRQGSPDYYYLTTQQTNDLLVSGDNVLAVQVHNESITSSDLSSIPFFSVGIKDTIFTYGNVPDWFNAPVDFVSSNLPIIVINTSGQEIVNDPKIKASMGIIYNPNDDRNYLTDPFNDYSGFIGVELHGQSSLGFNKKSYGIETRDSLGENQNVSLLGLPQENDWILYAPYSDKTLMRNALSYTLAGEFGYYAPRVRFCELVLNNEYRGVYVLTEKIKRDNNRVDIAKMFPEDISEPNITGGYIFKKDKVDADDNIIELTRGLKLIITEPKKDQIVPEQINWLVNYLNNFENVLYNGSDYSTYLNVQSFVDNFLIVEFTKNIDGYRLSTYFHKDREGKIIAAPVWDYNLSLGNADYNFGWTAIGWYYPEIISWDPNWWMRLVNDDNFNNLCKDRWIKLRTNQLSESHIFSIIDEWTTLLTEAQERNFILYPILGQYVWPNPGYPESGSFGYNAPTSNGPTTWQEEITVLKNFIHERLLWMDENMPGEVSSIFIEDTDENREDSSWNVFPNPFNSSVKIIFKTDNPGTIIVSIYDALGKNIRTEESYAPGKGKYEYLWDGLGNIKNQVASSVYFYVIRLDNHVILRGKIVKID